MSKISEVWINTTGDTHYFDDRHIVEFEQFLKEGPKDIVSVQITETMTKEEFDKRYGKLYGLS